MELLTPRLRLRSWTEGDRDAFAAMSLHPDVLAFLNSIESRADSDAWIDRQVAHEAQHGFGLWAVEERSTGAFIGSVGLVHVRFSAPFTPAVEVGWRIAPPSWGRGYAPEAAGAALHHGFERLGLQEIVAYTSADNAKSRRVMGKLGMAHDPVDDFDHPNVPDGHRLKRCVLYRLTRDAWASRHVEVAKPG